MTDMRLTLRMTAENLMSPAIRQALADVRRELDKFDAAAARRGKAAQLQQQQTDQLKASLAQQVTASNAAAHQMAQHQARLSASHTQQVNQRAATTKANLAHQLAAIKVAAQAQQQGSIQGTHAHQHALNQHARATQQANRVALAQQQHVSRMAQQNAAFQQRLYLQNLRAQQQAARAAQSSSGGGGLFDQLGSALRWVILYQALRDVMDLMGKIPGTMVGMNLQLEQATATFLTFAKSTEIAAQMTDVVRRNAEATPFSTSEVIEAARGVTPLSGGNPREMERLVGLAEVLATSNPIQGLHGATFALREAEAGQYLSLKRRFNIPTKFIREATKEGLEGVDVLQRALERMGWSWAAVQRQMDTTSGQWQLLEAVSQDFLRRMGMEAMQVAGQSLRDINTLLSGSREEVDALADAWGRELGSAVRDTIEFMKAEGPMMAAGIKDSVVAMLELSKAAASSLSTMNQLSQVIPGSPQQAWAAYQGAKGAVGQVSSTWDDHKARQATRAMMSLIPNGSFPDGPLPGAYESMSRRSIGRLYGPQLQGPPIMAGGMSRAALTYADPTKPPPGLLDHQALVRVWGAVFKEVTENLDAGGDKETNRLEFDKYDWLYRKVSSLQLHRAGEIGASVQFEDIAMDADGDPIAKRIRLGYMEIGHAAQEASKRVAELNRGVEETSKRASYFGSAASSMQSGIDEMKKRGIPIPPELRAALKQAQGLEGGAKLQLALRTMEELNAVREQESLLRGMKTQFSERIDAQSMTVRATTVLVQGMGGGSVHGERDSMGTFPGSRGYAVGTPYVANDGLAMLHRGEAVLSPSEVRQAAGGTVFIDRSEISLVVNGSVDPARDGQRILNDARRGRAKYAASRTPAGALAHM